MKFPDPYAVRTALAKSRVFFAGSQLTGKRSVQEDCIGHFNDECFVVADGVSGVPHGETASEFVTQTALWAYRHVRQRPYYWDDKRKFLRRIFRTSNLALWQKQREAEYTTGLATTLSIVITGLNKIWVGTVGDSPVYLYREGLIDEIIPSDLDDMGRLTNVLGIQRLGLQPHIKTESFLPGDIVLMMTDGVSQFVSEETVRMVCQMILPNQESVASGLVHLLKTAEENGSDDNMSAYILIKPKISEE